MGASCLRFLVHRSCVIQGCSVKIYCMSESKAILMAAAAEQFAKYGPRGTRVQDVVKAAGINERMIYHHFGSKDALYAAVMREQRTRLGEAWRPALDPAQAGAELRALGGGGKLEPAAVNAVS